jgi:tetratricopeptide (TPR) repeat protein
MRSIRIVTVILLIAAVGVAGCSKRDRKKSKPTTESVEQATPVKPPSPPPVETDAGQSGFVPGSSPAIAERPSFADGEAAYRARNYQEAVAIFEDYIDRKPGNGWGYYMLGLSAWKAGDFQKSEKAFDQALSIDPDHVKSLVNSGRLFIDQQRNAEALGRLTLAAEIDPDSLEVQRLLAATYQANGNAEEAVAAYRRVIDLKDNDAEAMNQLALLLKGGTEVK